MNNLKLKISTKILDLVEGLPRFRKGTISRLQDIRDRQREWSAKEFSMRKAPKEASIEFSQTTLILTFEHEEFDSVIRGLRKYLPKSEKVLDFTKSLRESENRLDACSWHNLGFIARERHIFFPDTVVDESLPADIDNISLSFHRILPSVGCILFEIKPSKSLSENLNEIQDKDYLGNIEFNKFWPLIFIGRSYSMGAGSDVAFKSIANAKDSFREKAISWIKHSFKWSHGIMQGASYVDIFKVTGNPREVNNRREWVNKNSFWLNNYGVDVHAFSTLEGDDFIVSYPRSNDRKHAVSITLLKLDPETDSQSEYGDFLEYKVRSVAISSIIFNVLDKYRNNVEQLRGHGFKNLYNRKRLSQKTQRNIQDIKRAVVILSRLEHELKQSKHWVIHSISGVGRLSDLFRKETVDLANNTLLNATYQLNQIKDAATAIDLGLTNYLSIQSIYVMYKLQKWMFILSVVVTIATVIGAISSWDNITSVVAGWADEYK